jgi:hypothetical protein
MSYLSVFIVFFMSVWMSVAMPSRAADAPYVQTPWNVVETLFKLGRVDASDYVIDLGSGDGRIVDVDDNLVRTARREAERQGVSDRVSFVVEDLFFVDLAKASVITLYMSESVNLRLRPALFKLKPGTRILSHDFDMAQWTPDGKVSVAVPNKPYGAPKSDIFLWVIPADASGRWRWQLPLGAAKLEYDAAFDQSFQMLSGALSAGGRSAPAQQARVRGDSVSFSAVLEREGRALRHDFSGRIAGDVMEGRVTIDGVQAPWRAARVARGKMDIGATLSLRMAQGGH